MDAPSDSFELVAARIRDYREQSQRLNEANTKSSLIGPLLGYLGWDTSDLTQVCHEYKSAPSDNPVDYALLTEGGVVQYLIEAKALGENLDDRRWAGQAIGYGAISGVEWVVLTNGDTWRIYNSHGPGDVDQKLFASATVTGDEQKARQLLETLRNGNAGPRELSERWAKAQTDKAVLEALGSLFAHADDPHKGLLKAVQDACPGIASHTLKKVLSRVVAHFEFPDETSSEVAVSPEVEGANPKPVHKRPQAATHFTISDSQTAFQFPVAAKSVSNADVQAAVRVLRASLLEQGFQEQRTKLYCNYTRNGFTLSIVAKATLYQVTFPESHLAQVLLEGGKDMQNTGIWGVGKARLTLRTPDDLQKVYRVLEGSVQSPGDQKKTAS